MRYDLVVFDFDGTLADSFPWFSRNLNEVALKHGFRQVQPNEVDELRSLGARQIMKRLQVPLWKVPSIAWDMRQRMGRDIGDIRLFEGVDEALTHLAERGVAIALLTSNSEANARRVLGDRLAGLVGTYLCGASLFGKQAKLRQLVKRLGVPRERVLCVGDEIRDLEAAHAEGLAFGAVAWGYTRPEALAALKPQEAFTHPIQMGEVGA